jgi:hypothetical protein
MQQLSLKHELLDDGSDRPLEVSLVVKGARPGTDIYANRLQKSTGYLGDSAGAPVIMASAAAAAPLASVAAEHAQAPAASSEAHAAPVLEEDGASAAKRARGANGQFIAGAGGAAVDEEDTPLPDVLQSVASQISDPNTVKKLYGAAARLLKAVEEKHTENEKLLHERSIMEKAANESKENSKVFAKQTAKEITSVLSSLYRHANAKLEDNQAAMLEDAMMKDPNLPAILRPLVVAASAMEDKLLRASKAEVDEQLAYTKGEVNRLSGKLGLYGKMGGQPSVVPQWESAAPAQHLTAAAPAALPVMEVAASGGAFGGGSLVEGNPALEGLKSYVRSACESKIYPSMFTRTLATSKHA